MGVQGDRIFAAIEQKGFPDPWSAFGECLSWESAYAVQLKQAIDQRKDISGQLGQTISDFFQRKTANLGNARTLLDGVLTEYDRNWIWQFLDERAASLDIDDVSKRWTRGLVEPPPPSQPSLQFNWRYTQETASVRSTR